MPGFTSTGILYITHLLSCNSFNYWVLIGILKGMHAFSGICLFTWLFHSVLCSSEPRLATVLFRTGAPCNFGSFDPSFQSFPNVSTVRHVQRLTCVCRLSWMPCNQPHSHVRRRGPISSCKLCHEAVWSSGSVVGSTLASFHAKVLGPNTMFPS